MARRRFEMHHIRQALLRMRQGDSDRDIAAAKIMGRRKAGDLRCVAATQGGSMPFRVEPNNLIWRPPG